MENRWSLRLRIFLFFCLIAVGGAVAIALGLFLGYRHLGEPAALSAFIIAGLVGAFALVGLVVWIWLLFDENVAKPLNRLATDLRARTLADISEEIDAAPGRYLGDLAPAVAEAASSLTESRGALAEAVARETVRIAGENARLAAILRDVPAGVLLCSSSHRIVLYNAQAADLLAGAGELGLDRPLFGLLREGPIRHAHGQLCRDGDDAAADLLCTTGEGGRVLQGQMRLIREEGAAVPSGYVLSLRDVTADLSSHAARERLLRDVVEEIRRPAANLRTALDVIADPQLTDERRARLQAAVADEAGTLVARISDFGGRQDASARAWWPMADVPAGDIADALRATLEADGVTLEARTAPLLLRCDGYALVQLLAGAARSFAGAGSALTLVIEPEDQGAVIDLGWNGGPPSVAAVDEWLGAPLAGGYAGLTGRDALDSHGTELWPEATAAAGALLRLPIPAARAETRRPEHHRRPEFYDFGLLLDDASLIGDERPLESLKYVVFDTETTGLAPTRGDEIVQIAAVRIVNGRMLGGESLDMLVDPERAIPAASTRVHHITDEMVAGAPAIDEAGRRFHRFCEDAVMVAHNAPFDMAFLRRHEARMGVRFANPILDTVLLSAILYGQTAEHSLDAIAERLAVHIAPEERHTALGDAKATAEILLKMLPMLREAGLVTLGQTIREFRKHARLLRAVE